MQASYAVMWCDRDGETRAGRLELTAEGLVLDGGDEMLETVAYRDLKRVRVGRSAADRLAGRQTVVVERRIGGRIRIAGVVQTGIISELAEHLAPLLGEEQAMSRTVVILPLREGSSVRAAELLRRGPPFDPETVGLERHHVFLTEQEAVFVFEADSQDAADRLIGAGTFWSAASDWEELVAGPPRLADDLYSWVRPHPPADVSFEPTPGPGDSDGGDLY